MPGMETILRLKKDADEWHSAVRKIRTRLRYLEKKGMLTAYMKGKLERDLESAQHQLSRAEREACEIEW